MRMINMDTGDVPFARPYKDVPQPMFIYHSTEELECNELNRYVFSNSSELAVTLRDKGEPFLQGLCAKQPTFLNTLETIVPEAFNLYGDILFRLTNMEVTITDACYVRVYEVIIISHTTAHLVTSSGMQVIYRDCTGGDISAAVRPRYYSPRGWDRRFMKKHREKGRTNLIKKYSTSKKPLPLDWKLIDLLLNPLRKESFLNTRKAAENAFGPTISGHGKSALRKSDIAEIMGSERIQNLIFKEMEKIMPELIQAIKAESSPTKVAVYLDKIAADAVANKDLSIKDKLLAVSGIIQTGYKDEGITLTTDIDTPAIPAMLSPVPFNPVLGVPPTPAIGEITPGIAAYADEDIGEKTTIKAQDTLDPDMLKKKIEDSNVGLSDERIAELQNDVGVMDDYIIDDTPSRFNPNSPLTDPDK